MYLSYTIRTAGAVRQFYRIVFDEYEVSMSADELVSMGYDLKPINNCLVKVKGFDYSGFVMCAKSDYQPTGIIAGLGADVENMGKQKD